MLAERRNYITRLAASLKDHYDTSSIAGLRQIAADNRIIVIESHKVIFAQTSFRYPQPVIFTTKSRFSARDYVNFAHELGHALLQNSGAGLWREEKEVEVFRSELTGNKYKYRSLAESFIGNISNHFKRPLNSLQYYWSLVSGSQNAYLNKIYTQNIDRYYNEINQ